MLKPGRKKKSRDPLGELSLSRAFDRALQAAPEPPGSDITPVRSSQESGESREERYRTIRGRIKKRLAERFIESPEGQRAYIDGTIYSVIGKYHIRGDMLDWDHMLRSIHAKLDAKVRLKMILHMAKKLKVRT